MCFEMVSPMTKAKYERFQGMSMSNKDLIAVCKKCGSVWFIVGYEDV